MVMLTPESEQHSSKVFRQLLHAVVVGSSSLQCWRHVSDLQAGASKIRHPTLSIEERVLRRAPTNVDPPEIKLRFCIFLTRLVRYILTLAIAHELSSALSPTLRRRRGAPRPRLAPWRQPATHRAWRLAPPPIGAARSCISRRSPPPLRLIIYTTTTRPCPPDHIFYKG